MEWEEFDSKIGEALDRLDSIKDGAAAAAINLYSTPRPNSHGGHLSSYLLLTRTFQPISNRHHAFTGHLQTLEYINMPNSTDNRDRASVEQDIDPTTRMALFKFMKNVIFDYLNACIFTGKQANVYHATKHNGQEFAVKVFKDRDHSMQGNYHVRHGNCKHNPRKRVKTWAENEMRNLLRLKAAGIRCPTPILLRLHVLVMEFIGKSGSPASCLKDANISKEKMHECYVQVIIVMRNLYQKCKLVHGDLSEYNILYYEGNLHIIDVSQSVDLNHPLAFKLLYEDCVHVSEFFRKNGVGVMSLRDLFEFIVNSSVPDESVGCYIEELYIASFPGEENRSGFCIPAGQNLIPEQAKILDASDYSAKHTNDLRTESGTDENEVDDDDDDSSDSKGVEPYETTKEGTRKTPRADKKASRKENKKKVKEEKGEARKTKTPKYLKKKKNKVSKNIRAR